MLVDPSCPNRTEPGQIKKKSGFWVLRGKLFYIKFVVHRTLLHPKLWPYRRDRGQKGAI